MKLAIDSRHGLVSVGTSGVRLLQAALNVPDGHPDPLLWLLQAPDGAARLRHAMSSATETASFEYARLRAPISRPGKVIAAPVNYRDHQTEMREENTISQYGVFLKASTSVIGPNEAVRLPYSDKRIDQEGELGVIIGTGGRHIPVETALNHVFGYCNVLDISVRSTEDRSTRKSFDTFTPIGPWVTTRDEIDDPGALELLTEVNGVIRQRANTADLIFDVPLLIAYASSVMTLNPGDVIATGTPAGVGPLEDGDIVRVAIEDLGELVVTVSAADAMPYASRPRLLMSTAESREKAPSA